MKKIAIVVIALVLAVFGAAFYGSSKAKESYDRLLDQLASEEISVGDVGLKAKVLEDNYDKGLFSSSALLKLELSNGVEPVEFEVKSLMRHGFTELFNGVSAHSDVKALTPMAVMAAKEVFGTDEIFSVDTLIKFDKTREVMINFADINIKKGDNIAISKPFVKLELKENGVKYAQLGFDSLNADNTAAKGVIGTLNFNDFVKFAEFSKIQQNGFWILKVLEKIAVRVEEIKFSNANPEEFVKDINIVNLGFETKFDAGEKSLNVLNEINLKELSINDKKAILELNLRTEDKNLNKDAFYAADEKETAATLNAIFVSKNYSSELKNLSFKNPNSKEIKFSYVLDASSLDPDSIGSLGGLDIVKGAKFDAKLKVQAGSIVEFLEGYRGLVGEREFETAILVVAQMQELIDKIFIKEGEYLVSKIRHEAGSDDATINDKTSLKSLMSELF